MGSNEVEVVYEGYHTRSLEQSYKRGSTGPPSLQPFGDEAIQPNANVFSNPKRQRKRVPRSFTERRKKLVASFFIEKFAEFFYDDVGKPEWCQRLLDYMKEPKRYGLIPCDVQYWFQNSFEFFQKAFEDAKKDFTPASKEVASSSARYVPTPEQAACTSFDDTPSPMEVTLESSTTINTAAGPSTSLKPWPTPPIVTQKLDIKMDLEREAYYNEKQDELTDNRQHQPTGDFSPEPTRSQDETYLNLQMVPMDTGNFVDGLIYVSNIHETLLQIASNSSLLPGNYDSIKLILQMFQAVINSARRNGLGLHADLLEEAYVYMTSLLVILQGSNHSNSCGEEHSELEDGPTAYSGFVTEELTPD